MSSGKSVNISNGEYYTVSSAHMSPCHMHSKLLETQHYKHQTRFNQTIRNSAQVYMYFFVHILMVRSKTALAKKVLWVLWVLECKPLNPVKMPMAWGEGRIIHVPFLSLTAREDPHMSQHEQNHEILIDMDHMKASFCSD